MGQFPLLGEQHCLFPKRQTNCSYRLLFISDPEKKIPIILEMCFTTAWLDAKATDDPTGRTNREIQTGVRRYSRR